MTLYKKELEERLSLFIDTLKKNLNIDLCSIDYHDYHVNVKIDPYNFFSIWYAPSKNRFSINVKGVENKKASQILELWNDFLENDFYKKERLRGWHLFCDGSFKDDIPSWAFCVVRDSNIIHKEKGVCNKKVDPSFRNVAAEIEAVKNGIQWLERHNVSSVTIHYDYEGLEKWAKGKWKTKNTLTEKYRDFFKNIKMKISWNKIKSHSGHFFNDLVDSMAKEEKNY